MPMPNMIWWIIGGVFVAPLLVLLGLFAANKLNKGGPGGTINVLWLILAVMLTVFLGFAFFSGTQ